MWAQVDGSDVVGGVVVVVVFTGIVVDVHPILSSCTLIVKFSLKGQPMPSS